MTLNKTLSIDGVNVPRFFYGTAWKEDDTERCVLDAVKAGFRAVDTANQRKHYHEALVGEALRKIYNGGELKREDLFLQTKFTHIGGQDSRLPYDPNVNIKIQVRQSFESSLQHLHTDYIDSLVLHGPSSFPDLSDEDLEVWQVMEELKKEGKVKFIGVSNVIKNQLEVLLKNSKIKPAFVQNRCYAERAWDGDVLELCKSNNILYQGFSLLTANTWILREEIFNEILNRAACSPAQLIFAFSMEVGMIPLTGTTKIQHMKEDLESFAVKLNKEDVLALKKIGE